MTDLEWLALAAPIALVVCVAAIVLVEEILNQAEMKRERAAAGEGQRLGYPSRMTIRSPQKSNVVDSM